MSVLRHLWPIGLILAFFVVACLWRWSISVAFIEGFRAGCDRTKEICIEAIRESKEQRK